MSPRPHQASRCCAGKARRGSCWPPATTAQDAIGTFAASKAGGADDIESFLDFARDHFDEGGPR